MTGAEVCVMCRLCSGDAKAFPQEWHRGTEHMVPWSPQKGPALLTPRFWISVLQMFYHQVCANVLHQPQDNKSV